ncbi:MAG: hypothetical protein DME39_01185 [Verrucomicrobia bacterium]|nr:MAG: hypothetical protein DME39_01185 [Verrucomicrobiota bacterium]
MAAKAHAGSEKNKAALRNIDNLISIPKSQRTYRPRAAHLQGQLVLARKFPVATGLWPVIMQIAALR